jgi:hypothetical protein
MDYIYIMLLYTISKCDAKKSVFLGHFHFLYIWLENMLVNRKTDSVQSGFWFHVFKI